MSWEDRTEQNIQLTSPDGNVFLPLWRRNTVTVEKKLGLFELPAARGVVIQDLDVGGTTYPITLFFDGEDHDLEADRFMVSVRERGLWSVVHPTKGRLQLQLVSASEKIDRVETNNHTEITTEWIQPSGDAQRLTVSQLAGEVTETVEVLNTTTESQFDKIVKQVKSIDTAIIRSTVDKVLTVFNNTLSVVYDVDAEIKSQVQSIQRGIREVIAETTIDIPVLAGQLVNMLQLPSLISSDSNLSSYETFISGTLSFDIGDNPTQSLKNAIAVKELAVVTSLGAIAESSISLELTTRNEAVALIEEVTSQYNSIIEALDTQQDIFMGEPIDVQYFSQSESFSDSFKLIYRVVRYLLEKTFDLAIEQRKILSKDSAPIAVTIEEYGSLGEDDSNFELFISSNNLKGSDILLLKAGTEIVTYV